MKKSSIEFSARFVIILILVILIAILIILFGFTYSDKIKTIFMKLFGSTETFAG